MLSSLSSFRFPLLAAALCSTGLVPVVNAQEPEQEVPAIRQPAWGSISEAAAASGKFIVTVKEWPADGKLSLPAPFPNITSAELVRKEGPLPLLWVFNPTATSIMLQMPEKRPGLPATIRLATAEESQQFPDGRIVISAKDCVLHGDRIAREFHPGNHRVGFWTNPADWVSAEFKGAKPGDYDVSLTYAAGGGAGTELSVVIAGKAMLLTREPTGSFYHYRTVPLGRVTLTDATFQAEARCTKLTSGAAMNFKAITLTPAAK